jgi:hypothetical protein
MYITFMPVHLGVYSEMRLGIPELRPYHPCKEVLIEKAGLRLMQKFSAFYETQKFENPQY